MCIRDRSSVTQTLAYLEDLLETPLFHRHAKGVRPTDACRDLLPLAKQVMLGVAESAEAIAARHSHGSGVVRLFASIAAINGLLQESMGDFHRQRPGIQVHLREAEGNEQLLAIARTEADLIACRQPPVVPEGWTFHPLLQDRFAIVCRARHPLASIQGQPGRQALQDAIWLALPAGSAARLQFDALSSRCDRPLQLHPLITRAPTMMWWLLLEHDLLAVLPYTLVRPLIRSGQVVELAVSGEAPLEPLGLLQPELRLGEAAQHFSDFMCERFSGL